MACGAEQEQGSVLKALKLKCCELVKCSKAWGNNGAGVGVGMGGGGGKINCGRESPGEREYCNYF